LYLQYKKKDATEFQMIEEKIDCTVAEKTDETKEDVVTKVTNVTDQTQVTIKEDSKKDNYDF